MVYLNHQKKGNKNKMEMTRHYSNDRQKREDFIVNTIGLGNVLFEIEEQSRISNKPNAILKISDTDILTVCEKGTGRIITRKLCRPGQLRKIFKDIPIPNDLMRLAIKYKKLGWNELY